MAELVPRQTDDTEQNRFFPLGIVAYQKARDLLAEVRVARDQPPHRDDAMMAVVTTTKQTILWRKSWGL